jgi:cation diffusion facilitator family transporter
MTMERDHARPEHRAHGGGSGGTRAIVAAFLANLGIAVAKLVGFVVTGSSSLLAEAVHSFADTGNQALLIVGGRQSRRVATAEHPFGYGRERYFWSFLVAVLLFVLGAVFSLLEGYQKLRHPHRVESPGWAVGILAVAITLEAASLRTAVREAASLRGGRSWWGFVRQAKAPEIPVVLLEDTGALLGLVVALGGVGFAAVTGDGRFDAAGSLAIGVLLGMIALLLGSEMRSLLIGEAAAAEEQEQIRAALLGAPAVRRLIHLRTMHLGPDSVLVAAKVELNPALSFQEVAAAINDAEARIRARVPNAEAGLIYLEPDVYRAQDPDEGEGREPLPDGSCR